MSQIEDLISISCLNTLTDPRKNYNQRHCFHDIITIVILASLCGADTWDEIEFWGNANYEWLHSFLELPNGIPSHDTCNRVFQMLDPNEFHEAFRNWVQTILSKVKGVVAIDGKTIRRSRSDSSSVRPAHIISAWSTEASLVLGQEKVDEKTNEITAIPELLKQLNIKGCTVTIDAMGTQKEIATQIRKQEADYILQVKDNQATLKQEIAEYFEKECFAVDKKEAASNGKYSKDYSGSHGRIETREYFIETEIDWMKEARKDWKDLGGIGACRATVEENGNTTVNITYSIFSNANLTAAEYGAKKRQHWGIENSLHWCLDIAFREDDSRMRAEHAAENMNIVRHMCLNMLKQEKSCKAGLKAKRKRCGWDKEYLFTVLQTLVLEVREDS